VILSDDVVVGDRPCIGQLVHAYNQTHGSVVAVMEVPRGDQRYGVIAARRSRARSNHGRLHKVSRLVEKPARRGARRTWRSSAATS
jgi:UTP-glucose-1-phosphate uridylyltransferase